MATVKTKKAHQNGYGKNYSKKEGDKYDHPNPSGLVKMGIVELVEKPQEKPEETKDAGDQDNGLSGTGGGALQPDKGDGKKHKSKSA